MSMTLRDYGRMGLFMLGGGKAGGKDILPAGWTDEATSNQLPKGSPPPPYGYFWWPRADGTGYTAQGIFGQGIAVFPELNLVIAMNSATPKATDRKQSETTAAIVGAIVKAAMN
jgi:CubicO group peptidase (beta-lactamase class C family)